MIEARFDDLTPGGAGSFALVEPIGVVEAHQPDEVKGAIDAAEAAAARGLWVAGFVAYEAAPGLDPSLVVRPRAAAPFARLPLAWFAMFEGRREIDGPEGNASPPSSGESPWQPSVDRDRYDDAIARIRELIGAGDTYQINYTLRMRARILGDAGDFYRDLCLAQRGGFAAYLDLGPYRVLSASPELFLRIEGDRIITRPMKGTRPRGRWLDEDLARARELADSVKDRAENAMIVDLLRNDLGRISAPGSVHVTRMFETERYETVWQMTSTVESRLLPGTGLLGVFRALFPSGSVTGAPKIRSMQIIAELEDSPRGVYTGAIGFVAPEGSEGPRAEFNVAIRTVVLDAESGLAEYGVGGGITHDSSAGAEYEEVLTKARVLTARRPRFALLETMRHDPAGGFGRLTLHLARLSSSARYFGFLHDEAAIREALEKAVAGQAEPVRVRLTLWREGSLDVDVAPLPPPRSHPLHLAIHDEPVDPQDPLVFHKTTLRDRFERAAAEHPDADDVLLANARGQVTESTIANVAVKLDGRWWTPPLSCGLLPGTRRAALLADGSLAERVITVEELRGAEEIALVNSTRGWRQAVLLDPG